MYKVELRGCIERDQSGSGSSEPLDHDPGHGKVDKTLTAGMGALEIAREPTMVGDPGIGPFNHPSSGKHVEAFGLDLVPVNGGIASQHAEALGCGEFLINGANERKQLLIEARVTAHRLRGISPRFAGFGERHIFSSDVTVENRLIERIAAFDCDVINLYGEGRIADEGENEVI